MNYPADQSHTLSQATGADIVHALAALLTELDGVLAAVDASLYAAKSDAQFFGATVGGHVRHTLDHIAAVIAGVDSGLVDYDHRERGTRIEQDPAAARAEIARLAAGLKALAAADPATPLRVEIMPRGNGSTAVVASSLGRELAFALSHMVHHNATVRGMLRVRGVETAVTFGLAPSTIAHQSACAR